LNPSDATSLAISSSFSSNVMSTPGSSKWRAPFTRKVSASKVLPDPGPPQTSVGRPVGRPPRVISSRPRIPVRVFGSSPPRLWGDEPAPLVGCSWPLTSSTPTLKSAPPEGKRLAATVMDVEGSIKSDLASAAQSKGGTLTPRRYQRCFILHTTSKSLLRAPAPRVLDRDREVRLRVATPTTAP
jgi:hypothetical protein